MAAMASAFVRKERCVLVVLRRRFHMPEWLHHTHTHTHTHLHSPKQDCAALSVCVCVVELE